MGPFHAEHPSTESERALHAHLSAYNCAFAELGLRFRWDMQTLAALAGSGDERARLAAYIEGHHAHLLSAYSTAFLCDAILAHKHALAPGELALDAFVAARTPRAPLAATRQRGGWDEAGLPALAGA